MAVNDEARIIAFTLEATRDVLRGSGIGVPKFVTWWAGLRLAPHDLSFVVDDGTNRSIILRRNIGSSSISSLREYAQELGAELGCSLVVVLRIVQRSAVIRLACGVDHRHSSEEH